LDGELYNHKLKDDFNKITSLVRKTKNIKDEDFDASKNYIQYHIYDVYSTSHEMTFEERLGFMEMLSSSLLSTCLVVVNTHKAESDDMLMELYQEYLSDGYEGQMIRIPNSKYDQKRSKNLLKRKPFHESGGVEDEYKIVDILEGNGNWSNKAKSIMCLTKDNKPFRATIKGNMEFAENVWKERDKYIGTWATVMCQNLTPDGIPRFPIAKDIGREDI
jgi:DNA ligase-1